MRKTLVFVKHQFLLSRRLREGFVLACGVLGIASSSGSAFAGDYPSPIFLPKDESSLFAAEASEAIVEWVGGSPPFSIVVIAAGGTRSAETKYEILEETLSCATRDGSERVTYKIRKAKISLDLSMERPTLFVSDSTGSVFVREIARDNRTNYEITDAIRFLLRSEDGTQGERFLARQVLGERSKLSYPQQLLVNRLFCNVLTQDD